MELVKLDIKKKAAEELDFLHKKFQEACTIAEPIISRMAVIVIFYSKLINFLYSKLPSVYCHLNKHTA